MRGKENEEDKWFPSNVGQVKVQGVELSSTWKLGLDPSDPLLSIGYSYLNGENNVLADISRYALDIISHQLIIGFSYSFLNRWSHSTYFRAVDRLNLDNYSLFDTKLSFSTHHLNISLFANNLLDQEYTETNLVPMPGRWIGMGIDYRIK